MKLRVLQGEHFTCHSCTNCCRDWHVELMSADIQRIESLRWPANDPLAGMQVLRRWAAKTFIAHRDNGACVFLNGSNGRCRIHEQFGMTAKPLGCRLFPFQIIPTFKGEATVAGRYDCPSIRQNHGDDYLNELPSLMRWTEEMGLAGGFDESTRCGLEREQIEAVCEFVGTLLQGFERGEERALFIAYLCDWIAQIPAGDLDRPALANVFAQLKQQIESAAEIAQRRPRWIERMAFRTLLGFYLRRDEDVLDGRAGRIGRTFAMFKIVLGFGSFQGLGLSHPSGKLAKARLFNPMPLPPDPVVFALHWRMIRNKLDSFQFMGSGNNGRDFLNGLRSLALLFPMVVAVARYSAANRNAAQVESRDVDYAVAAIEHSYGRLAILNQSFTRSLEKLLLERTAFARLVRNV